MTYTDFRNSIPHALENERRYRDFKRDTEAVKVFNAFVVSLEDRGKQPDAQIYSEPGALKGDTPLSEEGVGK